MSIPRVIPAPAGTSLSTFTILVNGAEMDREYGVVSIAVQKEVNRISWARIVIGDGSAAKEDFEISNQPDFEPGTEITIQQGYHSNEETIFEGIVVRHSIQIRAGEHGKLIVECRDTATQLTIGRKNAYFFEATDSDAISEILDNSGLTGEVESTSVTHKAMVQYDATDWDFIVARAEANGMIVVPDDGTIHVMQPVVESEGILGVIFGDTIIEFDGMIDARTQYDVVTGRSWDYAGQAVLEVAGTDPGERASGNLSPSTLAEIGSPASFDLTHSGNLTDQELGAWADACLLKSRLSKVCGRVVFDGFAAIRPGHTLTLAGVGERFNGPVFVRAIRQEFSRGKWHTEVGFGLSTEWFLAQRRFHSPAAGAVLPGVAGLHTGIVTRIDGDPEGEDRIQVKVPLIDSDADGIWARVAQPDAGASRGVFFRPEVDDEVLLGFLHDDPRQPVVLGGLHSSAKAAPIQPGAENAEKGIVSRMDARLIFNDEDVSIALSTPAGNEILLDEAGEIISVTDQSGNMIEMSSDGILVESAKDIVFKATGDIKMEAMNIEAAADMQLTLTGGLGAELSSDASCVIKGGIVQIN